MGSEQEALLSLGSCTDSATCDSRGPDSDHEEQLLDGQRRPEPGG